LNKTVQPAGGLGVDVALLVDTTIKVTSPGAAPAGITDVIDELLLEVFVAVPTNEIAAAVGVAVGVVVGVAVAVAVADAVAVREIVGVAVGTMMVAVGVAEWVGVGDALRVGVAVGTGDPNASTRLFALTVPIPLAKSHPTPAANAVSSIASDSDSPPYVPDGK
jgi:hypothetical protein